MKTEAHQPASATYYKDKCMERGLTKREHFSAMAMQGFISDSDTMDHVKRNANGNSFIDVLAVMAVQQADALIEALNK